MVSPKKWQNTLTIKLRSQSREVSGIAVTHARLKQNMIQSGNQSGNHSGINIFQHTPVIRFPNHKMKYSPNVFSHNSLSKLSKFASLQRLAHIVPNHIISWTVIGRHMTFLNLIRHKKYRIFIARDRFPALFLPLFSKIIALLLS